MGTPIGRLRGAASTVVVAVVAVLAASLSGTVNALNPPTRPVDGLDRLVHVATQHMRTADAVAARRSTPHAG